MASKAHELLTLAEQQFPDLTDAEKKLLHAVTVGGVANCSSTDDVENNPRYAFVWDASRTIRAQLIRWLCVKPEATRHIDPHGIKVDAAAIEGRLDLANVTIPVPLYLRRCAVKAGATLAYADTRTLSFSGSALDASVGTTLDATGAHVHGDVWLSEYEGRSFHAKGEVRLVRAAIDGHLICREGTFHHPEGTALDAEGTQVGGDVRLNGGFHAEGEVRLVGAAIGGHLTCSRGTFHHPEGTALDAEGTQVGGDVRLPKGPALRADGVRVGGDALLSSGFRAEGRVQLVGAAIGGHLFCAGGTFHHPRDLALWADGVRVGGYAFLNDTFHAEGEVRLVGAAIGGDLTCTMATFHHPEGNALNAESIQVGGAVRLNQAFRAEGTVRLVDGRVGQLVDDEANWPDRGNLQLDGFVYTAIAANQDATTRLRWLARQPSSPFRPQPYEQLAKVLRESGHEADAKRVLIAKERARWRSRGLGWVSWLLEVTTGYGYRLWRALIWVGLLVLIGGSLFGWGYDKGIVIPTKAEAYGSDKTTRQEPAFYPAFNRWLYAFDTLVPIINFGQKDYWGPQVACNRSGLIRGGGIRLCILEIRALYLYRWLHIIAGWVLITLIVTAFTNLVRRE